MDEEKRVRAELFARQFLSSNILIDDVAMYEKVDRAENGRGHVVIALEKALKNPDTNDFDVGVLLAATLLRDGLVLPDWLASFAADVLEGKRKRPTKRGVAPYANFARDYRLARAVSEVSRRFCIQKYTNNELSDQITAAQIVADAENVSLDIVHKAVRKFGGEIKHEMPPQDTID